MKREWQYECNRDEGSIALRPTDNPDLPRPYAFGEGVLERSCDFELQHASWCDLARSPPDLRQHRALDLLRHLRHHPLHLPRHQCHRRHRSTESSPAATATAFRASWRRWFFLPLPGLILSAVVLPLGLFRNNAHPTTIKKLLLWTHAADAPTPPPSQIAARSDSSLTDSSRSSGRPSVPLIILQCFFRACILLSTIHDAADKAYASINAIEALILVPQVPPP